jgi:hypothetical protein
MMSYFQPRHAFSHVVWRFGRQELLDAANPNAPKKEKKKKEGGKKKKK